MKKHIDKEPWERVLEMTMYSPVSPFHYIGGSYYCDPDYLHPEKIESIRQRQAEARRKKAEAALKRIKTNVQEADDVTLGTLKLQVTRFIQNIINRDSQIDLKELCPNILFQKPKGGSKAAEIGDFEVRDHNGAWRIRLHLVKPGFVVASVVEDNGEIVLVPQEELKTETGLSFFFGPEDFMRGKAFMEKVPYGTIIGQIRPREEFV